MNISGRCILSHGGGVQFVLFWFLTKHKSVFLECIVIWTDKHLKLISGLKRKIFHSLSTYEGGHYLWRQSPLQGLLHFRINQAR